MSTKSITVSASAYGFSSLLAYLEDYADQLEENVTELLDMMLREGETYARTTLQHVDTGETLSTIMGYREGNTGMILVGGNAIWIEFGTGVVANGVAAGDYAHPAAADLEGIDPIGTYGEGHGADPNGWYYKRDDGQVRHTYGIPASRFFYNTAQMLRREYARMAKEVFK